MDAKSSTMFRRIKNIIVQILKKHHNNCRMFIDGGDNTCDLHSKQSFCLPRVGFPDLKHIRNPLQVQKGSIKIRPMKELRKAQHHLGQLHFNSTFRSDTKGNYHPYKSV